MKNIFVGLLVIAGIMFYAAVGLSFINEDLIPLVMGTSIGIAGLSSIGLIVILVRERIRDKKEEDASDVFNKY